MPLIVTPGSANRLERSAANRSALVPPFRSSCQSGKGLGRRTSFLVKQSNPDAVGWQIVGDRDLQLALFFANGERPRPAPRLEPARKTLPCTSSLRKCLVVLRREKDESVSVAQPRPRCVRTTKWQQIKTHAGRRTRHVGALAMARNSAVGIT